MPKIMNHLAIIALTLAYVSCQTIPQNAEEQQGSKSTHNSSVIIIDVDSFYQWGVHPKVRIQGYDATELRAIIKASPQVDLEPIPPGVMVSPAPGLSVIEDGEDRYHIMPDCEITGRSISLDGRLRIFRILSKRTSHFEKPKA